jgi:murein DD-endopeptidase MepM/ murein hydrolase activator NlpD
VLSLRAPLVRLVLAGTYAAALLAPAAGTVANAAYGDAAVNTTTVTVPMVFPVLGPTSYTDTFLACRSGCTRRHFGQDLMGPKMRPLVAAFNGVVSSVKRESRVGDGNYVTIQGDNGWSANYLHVNNDTPGTDDGKGTARYAFAEGIERGARVFAGQLIGWSGDSGNAESTGPHLHFELRRGDSWAGTVYNAFSSLNHASHVRAPIVSGPHPTGVFVKACALCPSYQLDNGTKRYLRKEVAQQLGWDGRTAVTVSATEVNWYPKGPDVELPAGRAYRGTDDKIWFVNEHVRTYVPTREALAALGIPLERVRAMTPAGLGTLRIAAADAVLPAAPFYDGALLRSPDGLTLWVMGGGERHLVPDALTQKSWNLDVADAITVTAEQLLLPEFPVVGSPLLVKDGVVLKDGGNRVWLVTGGVRRPFPSWTVYDRFGYRPVPQAPGGAAVYRIPVGRALP